MATQKQIQDHIQAKRPLVACFTMGYSVYHTSGRFYALYHTDGIGITNRKILTGDARLIAERLAQVGAEPKE